MQSGARYGGLAEAEHQAVGPGEEGDSKDRIADLFSGEADSSEPLDIRRRSSRDELGKPGGQEDEGVPPLVLPFGQFLYADRQPVFVAGEGDGEEMLHILRMEKRT